MGHIASDAVEPPYNLQAPCFFVSLIIGSKKRQKALRIVNTATAGIGMVSLLSPQLFT